MILFRFSGYCSRSDYYDVWSAVIILNALLTLAIIGGWMRFPADIEALRSLEYLPLLLQTGLPVFASLFALVASSVRRCRDANCPVALFVTPLALLLVSAPLAALPIGHWYLLQQALLFTASMSGSLLGLVIIGLLLLADIGLIRTYGSRSFHSEHGHRKHQLHVAVQARHADSGVSSLARVSAMRDGAGSRAR